MREIRLHGSEGGGAETNRSFLPLSMRFFRAGVIIQPCSNLWRILDSNHLPAAPEIGDRTIS